MTEEPMPRLCRLWLPVRMLELPPVEYRVMNWRRRLFPKPVLGAERPNEMAGDGARAPSFPGKYAGSASDTPAERADALPGRRSSCGPAPPCACAAGPGAAPAGVRRVLCALDVQPMLGAAQPSVGKRNG